MKFTLVLFSVFAGLVSALNELMPGHGRICYHESFAPGDLFKLSFQIGTRDPQSSEQLEADFYLQSPSGTKVVNLQHVSAGSPEFRIQERGRYTFCFSNEFSGNNAKDVTFDVKDLSASESAPLHDTLDGQIKLLNRLVMDVKKEQQYIVIRERVHRNTAESTNDRVKWWSILQILIVAANAIFQVLYLKRFFEVRSNV